jgi:hypothetical protein
MQRSKERMQEQEAIELACDLLREKGYDAELYDIRSKKEAGRWNIYFQRKSEDYRPDPGDFFSVYVDDLTKKVQQIVHGK